MRPIGTQGNIRKKRFSIHADHVYPILVPPLTHFPPEGSLRIRPDELNHGSSSHLHLRHAQPLIKMLDSTLLRHTKVEHKIAYPRIDVIGMLV